MREQAAPFLPMILVALLLHAALLVWWEVPRPSPPPIPERPGVHLLRLAEPAPPAPSVQTTDPPRVQEPFKPRPTARRPVQERPPRPEPALRPEPKPPTPVPAAGPEPSPDFPAVPLPAPPPEPVVERRVGSVEPDPDILARYESRLAAWLERHKIYPLAAQRRRMEGEVLVRVRIDRGGLVVSYALEQSSGHRILEEAVWAMVERAQPLPPFPEDLPGDEYEFLVPVGFRLSRR